MVSPVLAIPKAFGFEAATRLWEWQLTDLSLADY
jgi:hypothetical protein